MAIDRTLFTMAFGRDVDYEAYPQPEGDGRGEAGERVSRSGLARTCETALGQRLRTQDRPGVVMGPDIRSVRILGEHDEPPLIVGPVA